MPGFEQREATAREPDPAPSAGRRGPRWRGWLALALVPCALLAASARAGDEDPSPGALTNVSVCALLEGIPGPEDPVRKLAPFSAAFTALERADHDPRRARAAYDAFARPLAAILREAARVFHPRRGEVDPRRAQRYLARYVLGRDAVLRMGAEAFEPRPEIAAAMTLAACRARAVPEALAASRALTGPDNAALRAFAALLLLDQGRADEARELLGELGEEGFLANWVRAELTTDPEARLAAHRLAGRHLVSRDQETALKAQKARLGL